MSESQIKEKKMERVMVNGVPAVKMLLTVRVGAFSHARSAVGGKFPSTPTFSNLLGILEGQQVEATVFSGTNVCGHTNTEQLREAFKQINPAHKFWIGEPQLEAVIAKFGDGKLGFEMSGMFCQQTPAEIEAELAKLPVTA